MPFRLVTAPTRSVVALDTVKAHLRVDFTDDDEVIQAAIDTGVAWLDGPEGALERCLSPQQWAMDLDAFPRMHRLGLHRHEDREHLTIAVPLPPVISIDSVTYVDPDGETQTLVAGTDYLAHLGEDACVEPHPDVGFWPFARRQRRAVSITFTAGYPPAEDAQDGDPAPIPPPLLHALKLITGDLYANRESITVEATRSALIETPVLQRLIKPFQRR